MSNVKFSDEIILKVDTIYNEYEEEVKRIQSEPHWKTKSHQNTDNPRKRSGSSTEEWAIECFGIMGDGYI